MVVEGRFGSGIDFGGDGGATLDAASSEILRFTEGFSIVLWRTDMPVITAIMEATPKTIPTRVSDERNLLLRIACKDIITVSIFCMTAPPPGLTRNAELRSGRVEPL